MDNLHIVFTEYPGYGWSTSSPQVRGLACFYPTVDEAQLNLDDALLTAGFEYGKAMIHQHEEKFLTDDDGNEYLVRFSGSDASFEAASRLMGSIHRGDIEPDMIPMNRSGDRQIIGVDPSQTLRWVSDQLQEDEAALVCYHQGDDVVYHLPFGNSSRLVNGWDMDDLELSLDSTVEAAVDAVISREAGTLEKHESPAEDARRSLAISH